MLKDTADIIVIVFAFVLGTILTVVDNPLSGELVLLGLIGVWELGKYLARVRFRHTQQQS